MDAIAPRYAKPGTVAVGTAAKPVALAVGITKLEVGPGSCTLPMEDSSVVFTAKTEFDPASKAAAIFSVGDIAISPGLLPALSGDIRAMVSFLPSMMKSPPKLLVELTPWEAKTRSGKPLTLGAELLPPQATKETAAQTTTSVATIHFFKRQAPNGMKMRDLVVKWWIITDGRDALPVCRR
jgi:hypothetical protein